MKFNDLIRVAIVLATLGYLFGGEDGPRPPKPEPCVVVPDYNGPMMALSSAGKEMEAEDRRWLSDAFTAAGSMVAISLWQELIMSTSQQQDISNGKETEDTLNAWRTVRSTKDVRRSQCGS